MRTTRLLLMATLAGLPLVAAACPPPPPPPPPPTTSQPAPACPAVPASGGPGADAGSPISSWGVNGTAYAAVVVGSVVYVGGTFSKALPPSGASVPRSNLAAFCLANGNLLSSFVANLNGQVWALTTDGSSVFVAGDFTTHNGQPANRLLRLNPLTGARVPGFNPPAIPKVALALDYSGANGNVYVGGDFTLPSQGTAHSKGASFNHISGAYTGWNPDADARIESLDLSPNGQWVFVGGNFASVGGAAHDKIARTSATNGAVASTVYGGNQINAHIYGLAVDVDSLSPFAATGPVSPVGSGGNGGNKLISYSATGAERWRKAFNGDAQAVIALGTTVYVGFHGGYGCTTPTAPGCAKRLLGFNKNGSGPTFSPDTNGIIGVRGLAAGANRLVAVGDFTAMGSTKKLHGLAIFP
jgi:hypothetical protein